MFARHHPHTVMEAMNHCGLSEEEAYFVLRFAGHLGYDTAIRRLTPGTLLRAVLYHVRRRYFVRVGGWENPHLMQWDDGRPAWEPRRENGKWRDPTPLTLLGRLTFYGRWWELQVAGGRLVCKRGAKDWRKFSTMPQPQIYWIKDGAPYADRVWFLGGPRDD